MRRTDHLEGAPTTFAINEFEFFPVFRRRETLCHNRRLLTMFPDAQPKLRKLVWVKPDPWLPWEKRIN